jgi:hypothetical protein
MTEPRIPIDLDELTAAWFSTILERDVRAATVVDAHSGTTGRARVALEHDDPELPPSMFVKFAPFDLSQRVFVDEQGMGVAEARFYSEVARDIPVRIPRAWYAAWDDDRRDVHDRRYVMVLEDLALVGGIEIDQEHPDLVTIVDGVIDNFAALHAAFFESERLSADGDLAWIARRSIGYGAGGGPFVRMAVESLGASLPAEFHEMAEYYCRHAADLAPVLAAGAHTLVHGDAHMGNMFAIGDQPGFLDWAVLGAAPGMRDVAYFLTNSIPTELRRSDERRWLQRYCDGLGARGVELDPADAFEQYRLQALTGWVAAVATAGMGSKWQPINIAVRGTHRSIAAVGDLDTLGAFRDLGIRDLGIRDLGVRDRGFRDLGEA